VIELMRPYREAKQSGVPWLSTIPQSWTVMRSKRLFTPRTELARPDDVQLSATQAYGVIPQADFEQAVGRKVVRVVQHLEKRRHVERDDFVISMRSFQGGLERAWASGCIRSSYVVLRPVVQLDVGYYSYLFKTIAYIKELQSTANFIRDGQDLNFANFCAVDLPYPPLQDQKAIARFLDHADRRIRCYIRAKQKLIALLGEQKQAIIRRAVTRGLDPAERMKNSGDEWVGDMPEHWRVCALKRVLRRLVDCEHKTAPAVENSDYRVVRTTAVRHGELRWAGTYCTTAEGFQKWTQRALPEPGDVIFTREAPAGEACVIPAGAMVCLGQRTVLMKVRNDEYDARFLVHMIYAGPPRLRIQLASQGSTVGHFNMDDIGWLKVLAPPLREQQSIVEAIERETQNLRNALERSEREIELLREYRTRLIADVVTGKLDVREAAAQLTDELDGAEPALDLEDSLEDDGAADIDDVSEEVEA
jgi:type I restriction enzyme S subunit